MKRFLIAALPALLLAVALAPAWAAKPVSLIRIEGVISPVALRLVSMAIDRARAEGSQALIIQLDTPGGLERSMRSIIQEMLNSEVPIIVFVGPTGARAASAGMFITIAAHVAAMAPATNIGAAHPVPVGGGQIDKESAKKIEHDAAAFARSIATQRGRNAKWAEDAVRKSISATEREAVKLKVVDLIAENVSDLLEKVDGRTVKTVKSSVTLRTAEAPVRAVEVGLRDKFLQLITDPNIAYILMMIGMLGLFFELSNPGVILPGVLGGISLILAFFAFQSLPINYAGFLLIIFGIILLILEIKVVSHGVLTIGGIISMVLGSLMLFDAPEADLRVSWWVILPVVGTTGGILALAVSVGVRALYRKVTAGQSGLIGQVGVARSELAPDGQVFIRGELWNAVAENGTVAEGESVKVTTVQNLTLKVTKSTEP